MTDTECSISFTSQEGYKKTSEQNSNFSLNFFHQLSVFYLFTKFLLIGLEGGNEIISAVTLLYLTIDREKFYQFDSYETENVTRKSSNVSATVNFTRL